ncbi:hypothetical protein J4Q44_G00091730 [Coregonus suidteri]|uniref:TRIM8/14/16/25/29/45/65 coiled-coil region domain-containing protein n=1 Tax=Coregonus suidteri TaxID=861788 RepID=A0AAN8M8I0_9TELE
MSAVGGDCTQAGSEGEEAEREARLNEAKEQGHEPNDEELQQEGKEKEELPPLYTPDPRPSPLYCGFYSQLGAFWLSMQCICLLCVMEEHKGHDTVSAEAERNEKQKQFGEKKRKYQKRIQEREKELRELRQAVKTLKHTAGATVDESERIFTELIRSIERRRSEVKEQIRAQEKSAVSRVEGLLQRLEQEVAELKRKDTDLKELSNTEDHIQFLQGFQSLLVSPESYVSPCVTVNPHAPFEAVKKVLSDLRERLETMSKGIAKMSEKIQIDPDPKTKEEFVIYSCQLTMDPNTTVAASCTQEVIGCLEFCKCIKQLSSRHPCKE